MKMSLSSYQHFIRDRKYPFQIKEDIPTQGDIDQWPHLCGVCLPKVDAEIGLLIACDVPAIFDPLEMDKRWSLCCPNKYGMGG